MKITQLESSQSIDLLMEATNQLAVDLTKSGFEDAGLWIFHIQDVLHSFMMLQFKLVKACNAEDLNEVPKILKSYAAYLHYGIVPEIHHHMDELEQLLNKVLPSYDDDDTP